jgi:uncharacterized protein (DUF1778 family)
MAQTKSDFEMLKLQSEASVLFVNAVLNPPEPNQAAHDAARRYEEAMGR